MPINKETIISVFTEKLTLEQWLKTINKALDEAVLTGVEIAKKGNATLSFKFTFEDGTYLETNDLVLQQGESINGAYIQNGHLYLTLTNSQTLDAGDVKPVNGFHINDSQHLIVYYQDGTYDDLGAIFQGDINLDGDLNVTGDITTSKVDATLVTGDEVVEKMGAGYGFTKESDSPTISYSWIYAGIVKNGNKLTSVVALNFEKLADANADVGFGNFILPAEIRAKLYPSNIGGYSFLDVKKASAIVNQSNSIEILTYTTKNATGMAIGMSASQFNSLTTGATYYLRLEETFLLSDNLAQ